MSTTQLQMRRGDTAQTSIFVGASGEITFDTDENTLVAHDGTTPGGHYMARASDVATIIRSNTISDLSQTVVDSFSTTDYRSAVYNFQISCGANYQSLGLNVLHDGTNVYKTDPYNVISNSGSLGTFDANVISNNLQILFTPANANTNLKFVREILPV
jgi:Major tropism determinant N-terminal domain